MDMASRGGLGLRVRVVDFDGTRLVPGQLKTVLPSDAPLRSFQPLAPNSVRWDLAKDIVAESDFAQLASIIIPEGSHGSDNSLFSNGARQGHGGLITLRLVFALRFLIRAVFAAPPWLLTVAVGVGVLFSRKRGKGCCRG